MLIIALFIFNLPTLNAQIKSEEKIEKMIKQNATSLSNPIYKVPCGTINPNSYLTSAVTVGKSVSQPLAYFSATSPSSHYINYSATSTVLARGKSFKLNLTANKTDNIPSAYVYAFADWNRDGSFETSLGKYKMTSHNKHEPKVSIPIAIPHNAATGKTRIRIHYTSNELSSVGADNEMNAGYIYDFTVFVIEKKNKFGNYEIQANTYQ